jgi:hypothetical protein
MHRVTSKFAVVGTGAYEIQGRSYPYAVLTTGEGDPINYSIGQDVPTDLPVLQWIQGTVEYRQDGRKLKARLVGWEPAKG